MKSVTAKEFGRMHPEEYILIDIRNDEEWQLGHIPGAVRIPREDILEDRHGLPKERPVIVYCQYGILSREAAEHLCEEGYEACHLESGYGKWLADELLRAADDAERRRTIEKSLTKRFRRDILGRFVKAITDYQLVLPGDKIAVCISGGKDSMLMAKLFQEVRRHNKIPFELVFLCMNPGYSEATLSMIESNAKLLEIPLTMFETRIFDAVDHIEKNPCYLCARMRRGYLYNQARLLGCNKIALGHHYDDVIETTLMSMLYSGQIQTMMPKLHSTNFEGMELIRPMYLIREDDIKAWRDANGLQFIRCACHFTDTCSMEGHGDSDSKRLEAKRLLRELKKTNDNIEGNIFKSMENVMLNAVLGYKKDSVRHSFLDEYDNIRSQYC